jgi:hypothetical protein
MILKWMPTKHNGNYEVISRGYSKMQRPDFCERAKKASPFIIWNFLSTKPSLSRRTSVCQLVSIQKRKARFKLTVYESKVRFQQPVYAVWR